MKEKYIKLYDKITPLLSDEELLQGMLGKADNMEKKRIRFKKPAIIAAAAVITVTAATGAAAAAGWDIGSVFSLFNQQSREESAEHKDYFYSEYAPKYYPEINEIEVPQSQAPADDSVENAAEESRIASLIMHECDEVIECDGYDIDITGYAFDGMNAKVFYDVVYDKDGVYYKDGELTEEAKTSNPLTDMSVFTNIGGSTSSSPHVVSVNDNIVSFCKEISLFYNDDMHERNEPAEVVFFPPTAYDENGNMKDEYIRNPSLLPRIKLETPDMSKVSLAKTFSEPIELVGYGSGTLDEILITPMNLAFEVSGFEEEIKSIDSTMIVPVYVKLKSGKVIDLSCGGLSIASYEDGNITFSVGTQGELLDYAEIESVQIFNNVYSIN